MPSVWLQPGLLDAVVKAYKAGEPTGTIASRHGLTEFQVAAKMQRLGLFRRARTGVRADVASIPETPPRQPWTPTLKADKRPLEYEAWVVWRRLAPATPVPEGKSLTELKPDDCKYPIAGEGVDTGFCGCPKQEGHRLYCPEHAALTTVKPRSVTRVPAPLPAKPVGYRRKPRRRP